MGRVGRRGGLLMLALVASLAVAAALAPKVWRVQDPPLSITVDLKESRLYLYEAGKLVQTYVVSVGMPEYQTPRGSYHISPVVWNPWWVPPREPWAKQDEPVRPGPENPMGRVKMYFAPEYYIHGTPDESSLGEPVSHGCVRMYQKDAIDLAWRVVRVGRPGVTDEQIEEILHSDATEAMPLVNPIPLEIR